MRSPALLVPLALLCAGACTSHERTPAPRKETVADLPPPQRLTPKDLPPRKKIPFEEEFNLPQQTRSVDPLACDGDDCVAAAREAFLDGFRGGDERRQSAAFRLSRELCIQGDGPACLLAEAMSGHLTELSENKAARFWRARYLQAACEAGVAYACERYAAWHRRPRDKSEKFERYAREAAELYAAGCQAKDQEACIRAVGPVPWHRHGKGTSPEQLERYWTQCDTGHHLACERAGATSLADHRSLTDESRARALAALEMACESRKSTQACSRLVVEYRRAGLPDESPKLRRTMALRCYAAPLEGGSSRCLDLAEHCRTGDQKWCEIQADRALSWLDTTPRAQAGGSQPATSERAK